MEQYACLYHGVVGKGESVKRRTGAVWFTLRFQIEPSGVDPRQSFEDCAWPVVELVGDVAFTVLTGGAGGAAAAALKVGTKVAVKQGMKTVVKSAVRTGARKLSEATLKTALVDMIEDSGRIAMWGQYAGYDWPFRCSRMPEYHIEGGPQVTKNPNGEIYLAGGSPFTVRKVNSCGNDMMLGSKKVVSAKPWWPDPNYVEPITTVFVPPKPDIQAEFIQLSGYTPEVGTPVNVVVQLANRGNAASSEFDFKLNLLGYPDVIDGIINDSRQLDAGEVYSFSFNYAFNNSAPENLNFELIVDTSDSVIESDEFNNKILSSSINVQKSIPDLEVTSFSVSDSNPVAGDEVTVSLVISNTGNDTTGEFGFALNLAGYPEGIRNLLTQRAQINAGDDYSVSFDYLVTDASVTNLQLELLLDAVNEVEESNENNNVGTIPFTITPVPQPDIEVTAFTIDYRKLGDNFSPQIAVDDNGYAIAVWERRASGATYIEASRYTPGIGWSTDVQIGRCGICDATGLTSGPQIAMDTHGVATVVWARSDGTSDSIYANRFDGSWGSETLVETDSTGVNLFPQIAVDDNGNAIAVWERRTANASYIQASRYTPGGGWGADVQIGRCGICDAVGMTSGPQISMNASGLAIVVWGRTDGVLDSIYANRFDGSWGSETLVETDAVGVNLLPQIALDNSGNAMAVWERRTGTATYIQASQYAAGEWGAALQIGRCGICDALGMTTGPQISMMNGVAAVVWGRTDGSLDSIYANRYDGSWGSETLLETDAIGVNLLPKIAVDGSGNAIAAWERRTAGATYIQASRYTTGVGWGPSAQIGRCGICDATGMTNSPEIAMDINGVATVVWGRNDGRLDSIYANSFDGEWGSWTLIETDAEVGELVTFTLTMSNIGTDNLALDEFQFMINQLGIGDDNRNLLTNDARINAGDSYTISFDYIIPETTDLNPTFEFAVDTLGALDELNEDNNVASIPISVRPLPKPDLEATAVSVSNANPVVGEEVLITVEMTNIGTAVANTFEFAINLKSVEAATPRNIYTGQFGLNVGEIRTVQFSHIFTEESVNDYALELVVDSGDVRDELSELNNFREQPLEIMVVQKPDLQAASITASNLYPQIGEEFFITIAMNNIGTVLAEEFTFVVNLLDFDGNSENIFSSLASLNEGESYTLEFPYTHTGAAGDYALEFVVDSNEERDEFEESNNSFQFSLEVLSEFESVNLIETDDIGINLSPQIAVDDNGNAIAVWERRTTGATYIQASRYTPEGGWGADVQIGRCGICDAVGMTSGPQIAMNATGVATVVWGRTDGIQDSIYANRFDGGWGSESVIETDDVGVNLFPKIGVDDSGNAIAVWERRTASASYIQASRYSSGDGWGAAVQIGRCGICDAAGMTSGPQISMSANGVASVVWGRSDGTLDSIYANRYDGDWGTESVIEIDAVGVNLFPQIAVDGSGNAIAVWERRTASATYIQASHYIPESGWSADVQIGRCGICDAAGMTSGPQISMDTNGVATVVWSRTDGTLDSTYANRFDGSWGSETLLETDTDGVNLFPQIAVDNSGHAIAVWERSTADTSYVQASLYAPGVGWGKDIEIERCGICDAGGMTSSPQISMDANGVATVVWGRTDGALDSIYGTKVSKLIIDTDGDGVTDSEDAFPDDPSESVDADGDGVGDNTDVFPDDPSESQDSDGDGVGDNADAFVLDPGNWSDCDYDGQGDQTEDADTSSCKPLLLELNSIVTLDSENIATAEFINPISGEAVISWDQSNTLSWTGTLSFSRKIFLPFPPFFGETTVFTAQFTDASIDMATGSIVGTFECIEGDIGVLIATNICNNYTFGPNGIDEGGGGDDVSTGPASSIADWNMDPTENAITPSSISISRDPNSPVASANVTTFVFNITEPDNDFDGFIDRIDTDDDNDSIPDLLDQRPGRDPLVADRMISAGSHHACALDDVGVKCWGAIGQDYGQINVPALNDASSVSAGAYHSCAIDDDGVKCWGANFDGQLNVPGGLINPTHISAGERHNCVLDDNGVSCWGAGEEGESGVEDFGQSDVPDLIDPRAVSAGKFHSCALDATGAVCWGNDEYGQIAEQALLNPTSISAGSWHSCAIDDSGVVCWGWGPGAVTPPDLIKPVAVSAGDYHTCALDNTGFALEVVCWGDNVAGETDAPDNLSNPVMVDAAGNRFSCAMDDNGVQCWGRNDNTQLNVASLSYDLDRDGLFDADEIIGGTDPANVDSDEDGLVDGAGGIVLLSSYPAGIDIDGDGYVDGELDLGTSPLISDTDGDGVDDGIELGFGGDPLVSNVGDLAPVGALDNRITLGDLLILNQIVLGKIQPSVVELALGDLNEDGQVNVTDLLLLEKLLLTAPAP